MRCPRAVPVLVAGLALITGCSSAGADRSSAGRRRRIGRARPARPRDRVPPGSRTPEPKTYRFRAPAAAFAALRAARVDVTSMANNHGQDYGPIGLADSLAAITATGFPTIGIGRNAAAAFAPYRVNVRGTPGGRPGRYADHRHPAAERVRGHARAW